MQEEVKQIPYFIHEAAEARSERVIKRLVIALIVSIVLAFATNIAWLYVWMQYDTISYAQDGDGINNVNLGTQGDVLNGTESESAPEEERQQ